MDNREITKREKMIDEFVKDTCATNLAWWADRKIRGYSEEGIEQEMRKVVEQSLNNPIPIRSVNPEKLYCPKCEEFAKTGWGSFTHPNEGSCTCRRCEKCWGMVYLKAIF